MLQSVIYRGILLPRIRLKDLHFLSRTFADLPNIRGDQPKTPAKPPDLSPAQEKGNCLISYLQWHLPVFTFELLRRLIFSGAKKWWSFITCRKVAWTGASWHKVTPSHYILFTMKHFFKITCRDPEGFSKQGSGTVLIAPTGLQPRQKFYVIDANHFTCSITGLEQTSVQFISTLTLWRCVWLAS